MLNLKTKSAQIQDYLKQKIVSGEFGLGERLPTERDLAAEFGCSLPTINKVMSQLEEMMLIERSSGRGTYVRKDAELGTVAVVFDMCHLSGTGASPFYAALMEELLKESKDYGHRAHFVLGQGTPGEDFTNSLEPASSFWKKADGVIAMAGVEHFETILAQTETPVVTVSTWRQGKHCVRLDYEALAENAIAYLSSTGAKEIGLISNTAAGAKEDGFYDSLMTSLGKHGISLKKENGFFGIDDRDDAVDAFLALREAENLDGLLITNDVLASHITAHMEKNSLSVPYPVICQATKGVDMELSPVFTRCAFDLVEICNTSYRMLNDMIANPELIRTPTDACIKPAIISSLG